MFNTLFLFTIILVGAYSSCRQSSLSDGDCDSINNNAECGYDGGDCCEASCYVDYYTDCDNLDCKDPRYVLYPILIGVMGGIIGIATIYFILKRVNKNGKLDPFYTSCKQRIYGFNCSCISAYKPNANKIQEAIPVALVVSPGNPTHNQDVTIISSVAPTAPDDPSMRSPPPYEEIGKV